MVKLECERIDSDSGKPYSTLYRARIAHGWLVLSPSSEGDGLTFHADMHRHQTTRIRKPEQGLKLDYRTVPACFSAVATHQKTRAGIETLISKLNAHDPPGRPRV